MKRLIKFIMIASIMSIVSSANAGSVPSLVNYQGKLTDANGIALSGTKTIECSIYDAATGDTAIWGPQVFTSVSLVNGMFNVILGEKDSSGRLISSAFTSNARYLGIKVGGVEITPRQQILSTPFAMRASNAPPIGTIIASMLKPEQFAASTNDNAQSDVLKRQWTLADGKDVTGSNFANITGSNNIPDLRGMFLRGVNDGRSDGKQDPDTRIAGAYQGDEIKSHTHGIKMRNENTNPEGANSTWKGGSDVNAATEANGGSETRPKNIAVYYYIKIN